MIHSLRGFYRFIINWDLVFLRIRSFIFAFYLFSTYFFSSVSIPCLIDWGVWQRPQIPISNPLASSPGNDFNEWTNIVAYIFENWHILQKMSGFFYRIIKNWTYLKCWIGSLQFPWVIQADKLLRICDTVAGGVSIFNIIAAWIISLSLKVSAK